MDFNNATGNSSSSSGGYINGKRSSGIFGPRSEPEPYIHVARKPVSRKPVAMATSSPQTFEFITGTAVSSETDLNAPSSSMTDLSPVSTSEYYDAHEGDTTGTGTGNGTSGSGAGHGPVYETYEDPSEEKTPTERPLKGSSEVNLGTGTGTGSLQPLPALSAPVTNSRTPSPSRMSHEQPDPVHRRPVTSSYHHTDLEDDGRQLTTPLDDFETQVQGYLSEQQQIGGTLITPMDSRGDLDTLDNPDNHLESDDNRSFSEQTSMRSGYYPQVDPVLFPNYSVYQEPIKSEHEPISQQASEQVSEQLPDNSEDRTVAEPSTASGNSSVSVASGSRAKELGIGVESQYVRQLRRRSAAVISDASASTWGLPVAIRTEGASKSILTKSRYTKLGIDVKHSHLAPRLLEREVDDENGDDDKFGFGFGLNSDELAVTGMNMDNPGELLMSSSSVTAGGGVGVNVLMAKPSTSALNNSNNSHGHSTSTDSRKSLDQSSDDASLSKQSTSASVPLTTAVSSSTTQLSQTTTRRSSGSSMESIENNINRIRLFVANPDSD